MDFLLLSTTQDFFLNPLVLGGFAVAISIAALSYMAGELFSMPSLKAYSKGEVRELAVTIVIVLFCILLVIPGGIFDAVATGFTVPPPRVCPEWDEAHGGDGTGSSILQSPITGAYYVPDENLAFALGSYFIGCKWKIDDILSGTFAYSQGTDGIIMPELVGGYRKLLWLEVFYGFLSTLSFSISPTLLLIKAIDFHIANIVPAVYLNLFLEANTFLSDTLGTVIMAFVAQELLLRFIEFSVPALFLPLGVAMRAFPFTRKTGSTIIAFCFAAYFIYPISILINWQIYDAINHPKCEGTALLQEGDACTYDFECCSNLCRRNKCSGSALTDFDSFGSAMAVCQSNDLQSIEANMNASLDAEAEAQKKYYDDLAAQTETSNESGSRTQARLQTGMRNSQMQAELDTARLNEPSQLVFADPKKVFSWGMSSYQESVNNVAQNLMLALVFVVNEIVLTLTLFKDFSLLIGGEPRMLGISKLV